jgi:2-polyprenyl-6-methoxyphenol hydroxylase-like FAD-dependent oxidoreductase
MTERAACCIAGGGPAGMMLGLLLARDGVDVMVLEKHDDFLRDFRGDTIHPSTLEILHELGMLDDFLKLPHQKVESLTAQVGDASLRIADFTHLPTRCGYIAFMPQWDFLAFLAERASRFATFRLCMATAVTGILEEAGRVTGVRADGRDGPLDIRAKLVVAADGRHSVVRGKAGLEVQNFGAPMDVLWFRLPRRPGDPPQTMGRFEAGRIFILINRGDYWQSGYVIAKGTLERMREAGIEAFRQGVATVAPFARDRVAALGWDDVKLLTVRVDRLRRWHRPGLLCIGDAAHAMSPVGGVGINLAIADAVAAANVLATPLRDGHVAEHHLQAVQRRRMLATRVIQRIQTMAQARVIARVLGSTARLSPPLALRIISRTPVLQQIVGRAIGLGIRPEHVATRDVSGS